MRAGAGAPLAGLSALSGRKVGVGKGCAVEAYVRKQFPAVQWEPCPDDAEALHRLMAGEMAGMVADVASIEYVRRALGLSPQSLVLRVDLGFS